MPNIEAKHFVFSTAELRELIAWPYFFWTWGVAGKSGPEDSEERIADARGRLREEAEAILDSWEGQACAQALLLKTEAVSDGDDIIIKGMRETRLPMLRQQEPPFLCLADYIRPKELGGSSEIGLFCTSVSAETDNPDAYARMMAQTLADRLAEAAAEKLSETMPGLRPAVGYPSMPDMSLNFILDDLLGMKRIGVRLTESGMMQPHASVSGLIIQHPQAQYFNISRIGDDQLLDYARRRGMNIDEIRKFLK